MKPLDELQPGEKAFIVDLRNPRLSEKLLEMGIFPGALVEVKEHWPKGNCILISVNRKNFRIFTQAASSIITNKFNFEFELN